MGEMVRGGKVAYYGEWGSARHASTRETPRMEANQERVPRLHRYLKRLHPAGWAGFVRWSSFFRRPERGLPHQEDADAQKEASSHLALEPTAHENAETNGYPDQYEGEPTVGP